MNNIQMIQISQLKHHPENPRKDLGDLTELAESIKKNGIMQNLTVVFEQLGEVATGRYLVVIGNRRMEAAKIAGLEELPCVISDMDHREQIATMLEENMQRADLTVYEQAQGFQMMMDLGYKPEEISEKTGFSETTVRRRLKMAELDKETFKKAVGKQITMDDLDRLGQLESVKERNAILEEFGENNFNWKLNREIEIQKAKKVKGNAHKMLQEAKIEKIPEKDKYKLYSGEYEQLYNNRLELDRWDGKKNFIPNIKDGTLFYTEDETDISFYVKKKKQKAAPVRKTEEELERERKIDLAWKVVDRITLSSADMRAQFADGLTVKPSNSMQMLRWAIIASMSDMIDHNYNNCQGIRKFFELDGTYKWDMVDALEKQLMEMSQSEWPLMILAMFEGWSKELKDIEKFTCGYRGEFPKWQRNTRLEQCYKWLTEFGYQMSDEEIQMMAGTHPVFKGISEE